MRNWTARTGYRFTSSCTRSCTDAAWPGDLIPAERELLAAHGVSGIMLRQVLDMLVRDGLIVREQGRGSFVEPPRLEKGMLRIFSFSDDPGILAP